MNPARLNLFLSVTAIALLAANWQVRSRANPSTSTPSGTRVASDSPQPSAQSASASRPAVVASDRPVEITAAAANGSRPRRHFNFDWSAVETSDYKQYADNLRAIGLPEELVQSMVIADIEEYYAPNELGLQRRQVVHDASWTERGGTYEGNEWERISQLRDLQIEKQAVIKEVLGIYVPRPIVRTPRGQNYEAYEYAIGLMPEEKRIEVQNIFEEHEILRDVKNFGRPLSIAESVEIYRVSVTERHAALKQILTPEEFDLFERSTTSCGTEFARQTIGMEPTPEEFATMFQLADKCWQDCGGVYGWWRAVPLPPDQINAAQEQLQVDLKAALGADRYLDYQIAATGVGQQLQAFATRYDLPRESLAQAFDLQRQIDWLEKGPASVREVGNGLVPPPTTPTEESREVLETQLRQVLGPAVWEAWQDGRNRQVTFDPLK